MKKPHEYTANYRKFKNKNPGANALQKAGALNKVFNAALKHGIEEGEKLAKESGELIKKPVLDEEKYLYMVQKNPILQELVDKFNL